MKTLKNIDEIKEMKSSKKWDDLTSAEHDDIKKGMTSDIYFVRGLQVLEKMGLSDSIVTAEIFANKPGVLAGLNDVIKILEDKEILLESIEEGKEFEEKQVIMKIKGKYSEISVLEPVILGCLASASGWATAAREVSDASDGSLCVVFGSRNVHPSVAPVMERAAYIGGVKAVSNIMTGIHLGLSPVGTMPHSAFLLAGDTVDMAVAYDENIPEEFNRVILVDTYRDEVEESLRVAEALGKNLHGVRLDTPAERGGVTPDLVREVRANLDLKGYQWVKIYVSGGMTPYRIRELKEAGADAFFVGSYISSASPIAMTMDIKEINGKAVAKRGRIPGETLTTTMHMHKYIKNVKDEYKYHN